MSGNLGDWSDTIVAGVPSLGRIKPRHVKQRDVFDIFWLHGQGVQFRPELVTLKLDPQRRRSFAAALRERAEVAATDILEGGYQSEMSRFLPEDSSWLFVDKNRAASMAAGLKTLLLDNAKRMDVGTSRRTSGGMAG